MDELRFDGKTVIVTGGGRGFGRQHALLFGRRGARVVVIESGMELDGTGSSPEPAALVAREITEAGGEALAVHADLADPTSAAAAVATAIDAYGALDVLVNNAGISDADWFEDLSLERIHKMTNNQYFSTVNTTKASWAHLIASKGCIVNTASEAILGNVPKTVDYAGAKGAVFSFTRALALDGKRHGVRVNAITPRGNTRLSAPDVLAFHFDAPVENFQNEYFDQMKPEYVSPAVVYLAHESCDLTGVTLVSGVRQVKLLACIETEGITVEGDITPEDVASGIDQILDTTNQVVMGIEMFN